MQFRIRPNTYIYLVLLLLLLPLKWLLAWSIAVLVHEVCHLLAVFLCGGKVREISVDMGGVVMQSSALPESKRIICSLAGPLGGFLPVLLGRYFPRLALCSWLLSVYNLLPILPLDGGQILKMFLKDERKMHIVEIFVYALLSILAACMTFVLKLGVLPLLAAILLWLKHRKIPCKEDLFKLQ